MPTVTSVMADLRAKGSDATRRIYARHGMPQERTLGVSVASLKVIARQIAGNQRLACDLYDTGIMEAMYLAGLVADGSQVTTKQLNAWAKAAKGLVMIAESAVPWVATENARARELASKWIKSNEEHVAACGWCTYSGIVSTRADETLDLAEIDELLTSIGSRVHAAPNRVRYTMNGFLIAVGTHVKPLAKRAQAIARKIGAVSVEMGETACKVPLATAAIQKAVTAGKLGKKRNTIRC
jgi:3-methyladenine DNA glycosylase AlkD